MERIKILPTNSYGSHLPTRGSVFGPVQKGDRACRGQKEGYAGQMDRYRGGYAPSQDKIHHHTAKIEGRGKNQVYPAPKEDYTLRPGIAQRLPGKPRTGTLLKQRNGKRKRQGIHKAIQPGL